jgi:hypothetical protein
MERRTLELTREEWLRFVDLVALWQRNDGPLDVRIAHVALNQISIQPDKTPPSSKEVS